MGLADISHDAVQELKRTTRTATTRMHVGNFDAAVTALGSDGWRDLGATNPGSQSFEGTKEVNDVWTGAPRSVKERHITSWSGTINFELYDYTGTAIDLAIGTSIGRTFTEPTAGTLDTTIDEVGSGFSSTTTQMGLFDITNLAIGDRVAVHGLEGAAAAGGSWEEVGKVQAIDTGTNVITIQGNGLSQVPPDGARVLKIERETSIVGGNDLRDYKFRALTSFNRGELVVIFSEKGNFTSPVMPNFGDGTAAVLLPMTFGSLGVPETVAGFACDQLKIWEHHIIYANC